MIRIGYYFGSRKIQGNITVTLPLQERAWSHLTAAGKRSRAVSRETFVAVMNNISKLLIRAKYHSDQVIGMYVLNFYLFLHLYLYIMLL